MGHFQPPQPAAPAPAHHPPPPVPSGPRYFAVYDYTAADDDEISFNEGDLRMMLSMKLQKGRRDISLSFFCQFTLMWSAKKFLPSICP